MTTIPPPPKKGRAQLVSYDSNIYWESVSVSDPCPNPPNPEQGIKRIFIMAGQSNNQSANPGPKISSDSIDNRIFQLSRGLNSGYNGGQKNTWIPAQDPLQHHLQYNSQSVGFGLTFAKEFLKEHPNDIIYLVPCSMGGSGFRPVDLGYGEVSWRKTFQGGLINLYNSMMESYNMAKKLLPDGELSGVLFHQGESDIDNWSYQHDLNNFVKNVREDTNNPNLYFICGTMLKSFKDSNPQTSFVDSVHKGVPSSTWLGECCVFDDLTSSDMQSDFVHFSAKAQRIMGKRYYEKWKKLDEKYQQKLQEWKEKQ